MWYIHTIKYDLALRKKEILQYATTWMNLEDMMLSEMCQPQKDKNSGISFMWSVQSSLILVETGSRKTVSRCWGGRKGAWLPNDKAPPRLLAAPVQACLCTGLISDSGEGTLLQERLLTKSWLLLLQKEKGSVHKWAYFQIWTFNCICM